MTRSSGCRLAWPRLLALSGVALVATLAAAAPARPAQAATSRVAYITDFGGGLNDTGFPGASIFVNAVTGSVPGSGGTGTYNGATFVNVPVATIDASPATALNGFDTAILY